MRRYDIRNKHLRTLLGGMAPLIYLIVRMFPISSKSTIPINDFQPQWGRAEPHIPATRVAVGNNGVCTAEHARVHTQYADLVVLVLSFEQHWVSGAYVQVRVFMQSAPVGHNYSCPQVLNVLQRDGPVRNLLRLSVRENTVHQDRRNRINRDDVTEFMQFVASHG
jgi:hypothetical protein